MNKLNIDNIKIMSDSQVNYEMRFNCVICMEPKLEMVYGHCQHRFCADCLYINSVLRESMNKCPMCARPNSFPLVRPKVSDDSIQMQKIIGIAECPNKVLGCKHTMWEWEVEDHLRACDYKKRCSGIMVCSYNQLYTPRHRIVLKSKSSESKDRKKKKEVVGQQPRRSVRLMRRAAQRSQQP
ncbi:unnamed protein product [Lymnaea stagnalis]|uniref:RING-type domain-containing protein n=1 Tax=Lymnaea stagnalis TaxID=6523 RepID=A0AAV2HY50_LYMST